jgi:hypothetical protein
MIINTKILGVVVTIAGVGISMLQKKIDDDKLQEIVKKEVENQLKEK